MFITVERSDDNNRIEMKKMTTIVDFYFKRAKIDFNTNI